MSIPYFKIKPYCLSNKSPISRPTSAPSLAQLLFSFAPLIKVPLSLRKANPITFNGGKFRTNIMRKSAKNRKVFEGFFSIAKYTKKPFV